MEKDYIRCYSCGNKYIGEIELLELRGITERYSICKKCGNKCIIDYYDDELDDLAYQVNLRMDYLKSIGLDAEKDNELQNLEKRTKNLSSYLMSEALRRSEGQTFSVHLINFTDMQED